MQCIKQLIILAFTVKCFVKCFNYLVSVDNVDTSKVTPQVVLHYPAKHVLYLQGILDISKSIIKDLNIQKMYKSGFTVVRIRSFMKLLTNQKGKYP